MTGTAAGAALFAIALPRGPIVTPFDVTGTVVGAGVLCSDRLGVREPELGCECDAGVTKVCLRSTLEDGKRDWSWLKVQPEITYVRTTSNW